MSESVPIGMEMESAGCIRAWRAAQRDAQKWYCRKCWFENWVKDYFCKGCGKSRYRKRPVL